ncbi:hypothetical protein IMCC9480_3446 [Oxalobacteraceae bacterium IMCC9480]|nr:hypothetical protein IMCC9480_3446 [Oxalobacteraceae bacterium IMCC9480]
MAIIPFLLLPLILYFLPESPSFLLRSNRTGKMGKTPNHSPKFDIDEAALAGGARTLTAMTIDFLDLP